MTGIIKRSLQLKGSVANYFQVENHLLATRTANAYKALDLEHDSGVCLWLLRSPNPLDTDGMERFHSRLDAFAELGSQLGEIVRAGIDVNGVAFIALPSLDGHPVIADALDVSELERRFMSCVRLIDLLHQHGITCGDLCGNSFWMDRDGTVRFISLMGSLDSPDEDGVTPPVESLHYLAPEQKISENPDPAVDVYALGVLGYFLFARQFPHGSDPMAVRLGGDSLVPVSQVRSGASAWVDRIFMRCLDPDPAQRFTDAGALLRGIAEVRTHIRDSEQAPLARGRYSAVQKDVHQSNLPGERVDQTEQQIQTEVKAKRVRGSVLAAVIVLGIGLAVALHGYFAGRGVGGGPVGRLPQDLQAYENAVQDDSLKSAIKAIGQEGSADNKAVQFDRLAAADDPLAHDVLVKSALSAPSQYERKLAEKAIIERTRRLNIMRTAEQVLAWLRTIRGNELPASYEALLKAINPAAPQDERSSLLRQAYASNPVVALKIAAAMGLDSENISAYKTILSQLVGDSLDLIDADSRSVLALMLAHPQLSQLFGADVVQRRKELGSDDLVWLLGVLADRSDFNVRAIAAESLERKVLSPIRNFFLTIIRDRADLPSEVLRTLVRAAGGVLGVEDVTAIAWWYDMEAEKILFAICADSREPTILQEAFDIAAGKSLTAEPQRSLVNWIRSNYWQERTDFAHVVGITVFADLFDDVEISEALEVLNKHAKDGELLSVFIDHAAPRVVHGIVVRYSEMITVGRRLKLLSYPDKAVRLVALDGLEDENNIAIAKIVLDNYEKETDPEIREKYEKLWYVRERKEQRR